MTTAERGISQSNKSALRNPWVLGWLGLLTVVLGANFVMITLAVVTNPGLVEENYYERGRDHERNFLKQKAMRSSLGWQLRLDLPEEVTQGEALPFRLAGVDKLGLPLKDAKVTIAAYRPSDASADFSQELAEVAPGVYQARLLFPLKGLWEITARIAQGEAHFDVSRRFSVKGS